jgi:hypothetical protein
MVRRLSCACLCLTLGLLTAGCATRTAAPAKAARASVEVMPEDKIQTAWQLVATDADKQRLSTAKEAWDKARADVDSAGLDKEMAAEGPLLDPTAALPRAALPPGPYECRMVKLGRKEAGKGRAIAGFKAFSCYVEAEGSLLTIVKQTGSQRPAGRLWPDDDSRMIFLGGLALDEESEPPAYGADADRDVAGYVERIAPFRWRLVMPWPHGDSVLDVLELAPIADPIAKPAA